MDVMALRRNLLMQIPGGGLPAAYQQVEWIQSTGTQYIDTGLTGNIDREWIVEISDYDNNENPYASPFGISVSGSQTQIARAINGASVYSAFGNKVDVAFNSSYQSWSLKVKLSISKDGVYEDNVHKVSAYTGLTYADSDVTMAIFARKETGGSIGRLIKAKMYSFICKENGVIIANLVPCIRKSDSEPGMYDIVRKQFLTNAGTGTFVIPS